MQKLSESGKALAEVQAFQGGALEAHSRESPLAGILFTVYVVSMCVSVCKFVYASVYHILIYLVDIMHSIHMFILFVFYSSFNGEKSIKIPPYIVGI